MTSRRRSIAGRDQRASAFSAVLLRLCDAVSAAGAALVDAEGETVDYAGAIDPFDIKVAAAEWVVVLSLLRASRVPGWKETEEVIVHARKKSFFVQVLEHGYAVVVQLPARSFAISRRAIAEAVRELCAEAGLQLPEHLREDAEQWRRIDVRCAPMDSRRPAAIWTDAGWAAVEVLGRWTTRFGYSGREVGYRARLSTGAEITLVRERLGRWYTDSRLGR